MSNRRIVVKNDVDMAVPVLSLFHGRLLLRYSLVAAFQFRLDFLKGEWGVGTHLSALNEELQRFLVVVSGWILVTHRLSLFFVGIPR